MAWEGSTRRDTLPKDWHKRRARTWRNAGGQCQWTDNGQRCTWTGRLNGDGGQVDHAVHRLDHDQLQWLCPTHHTIKTQREAQAARLPRQRPAQRHPGLLDN